MPKRPGKLPPPPPQPPSVRGKYERLGVEPFYEAEGATYRNPHEPIIRRAIIDAVERESLDISCVLDLAAGSGEATLVLRELGAAKVDGVDPYTFQAYEERTGNPAERFTFADIAAGAMAGRTYSLVVCSFALHLCEPSRLPVVAQQLSKTSSWLLILTPHKRPDIREEWGWRMTGEKVIERVRCRMYERIESTF